MIFFIFNWIYTMSITPIFFDLKAYFEEQDIQERQRLCKLLPVVKGSGHALGDKYHYIQRSNHLCSDEPHFLEKLLQAAKGNNSMSWYRQNSILSILPRTFNELFYRLLAVVNCFVTV